MRYALIVNGTIQNIGGLPSAARRLDTGEWVCPVGGAWTPAQVAACGYVEVVGTPRPADTPTTTFDYSVVLVAGVPTETWTARPKTQAEIDAATNAAARMSMLDQLNAGVASIEAARAAAAGDIPTADTLRSQALTLQGQADTQRTQVAAFVPSATYKQTDLVAIRDAIATVLQRQSTILSAFADTYTYRKANDQNAVTTDDALLWLARLISGRITG